MSGHVKHPPHIPLKRPQVPSNRDHKALNRGTLRGLGSCTDNPLSPKPWALRCAKKQGSELPTLEGSRRVLGCSGDLVSRLISEPYGASHGL